MSRRIEKKQSEALTLLEDYTKSLRRQYGPTYTVDANEEERMRLVQLRKAVDFPGIAADGITHD